MKWFHKDSDARKHKTIRQGKAKFGKARFGLFFNNLLEVVAEFYRIKEPDVIEMPWSDFAKEMEFSNPREVQIPNGILFQMLSWLSSRGTIRFDLNRDPELNNKYFLKLYYESFQERADNYTKKMLKQSTSQEEDKKKKEKKNKKQKNGAAKKVDVHPVEKIKDDRLNSEALKDFYDWRKDERKPKAPMGPRAIQIAYKFLIKYPKSVQRQIVDKSIMNGWQGLFEPDSKKKKSTQPDDFDPYDTQVFKRDKEKTDKITYTSEEVETSLSDDPADFVFPAEADEIDWEALTPEEKKTKWAELKAKSLKR